MVKVKRTFPAPGSLAIESQKKTGHYDKPDVIRQLREDFHDKCYICEIKPLQDPEERICFRLQENNVDVLAKDGQDEKAVRTAELVWEVFNKKNTEMRVVKSEMRLQELQKEMNILYDTLEDIKKNPASKTTARKLKALLRRESGFAAFKRCYVRDHAEQFPQLLPYIK